MANEKYWIVKTWDSEEGGWKEAARFETLDEAAAWAGKNLGPRSDYTFEDERETERQAKRAAFGTGEVKYNSKEDFPDQIDYCGMHWYRTEYDYTFETGMKNLRYETNDTDDDVRLYIDAAGNIWCEEELGIL